MVAVRTFMTTLFSCRTMLCLRLCSSAVGTTSGSLVRKIAVLGTRVGGLRSSWRIRSSSGRPVWVLWKISRMPRTQVHMARMIPAAIIRGT